MLKRIVIILAVVVALGYGASVLIHAARQVGVNQGYEPDQPIAYSHKVHAGDNRIPCLYCHFGAEQGRYAGIPPAKVCMNCHAKIKVDSPEVKKVAEAIQQHRPIEWVKVHHLPAFVAFNHSQHVVAGKIACQECHGPVETMTRMRQDKPLTMGWCIECHRSRGVTPPEGHLEDPSKAIGGLDCAKCHY